MELNEDAIRADLDGMNSEELIKLRDSLETKRRLHNDAKGKRARKKHSPLDEAEEWQLLIAEELISAKLEEEREILRAKAEDALAVEQATSESDKIADPIFTGELMEPDELERIYKEGIDLILSKVEGSHTDKSETLVEINTEETLSVIKRQIELVPLSYKAARLSERGELSIDIEEQRTNIGILERDNFRSDTKVLCKYRRLSAATFIGVNPLQTTPRWAGIALLGSFAQSLQLVDSGGFGDNSNASLALKHSAIVQALDVCTDGRFSDVANKISDEFETDASANFEDWILKTTRRMHEEIGDELPMSVQEAYLRMCTYLAGVCGNASYEIFKQKFGSIVEDLNDEIYKIPQEQIIDIYKSKNESACVGDNADHSEDESVDASLEARVEDLSIKYYADAIKELSAIGAYDEDPLANGGSPEDLAGRRLNARRPLKRSVQDAVRYIEGMAFQLFCDFNQEPKYTTQDIPNDDASRNEWHEFLFEQGEYKRELLGIVDEMVQNIVTEILSSRKQSQLSDIEIAEVVLVTMGVIERLAHTILSEFQNKGAFPGLDTNRGPVYFSIFYSVLREVIYSLDSRMVSIVKDLSLKMESATLSTQCDMPLVRSMFIFASKEALSLSGDLRTIGDDIGVDTTSVSKNMCTGSTYKKILRNHPTNTVVGLICKMPEKDSFLFHSVDPHSCEVMTGRIASQDEQVRGTYATDIVCSHQTPHNFTVRGKGLRLGDVGNIETVAHTAFAAPSHSSSIAEKMKPIEAGAISLNRDMKKALYLHCPAIMSLDNVPEPLFLVEREGGRCVVFPRQYLLLMQLTLGIQASDTTEIEELVNDLGIQDIRGEWDMIELPDTDEQERSLFDIGSISGRLLSVSSEKDMTIDQGGNGAEEGESELPRLQIITGILLKHGIRARFDYDEDEQGENQGQSPKSKVLPSESEGQGYTVVTLPEDMNAQFLVSNRNGRAAYFLKGANNPKSYVDISPKELRTRYGAQSIPWASDRQWMDAVESIINECAGGTDLLQAEKALRDFPDDQSCALLRTDMEKVLGRTNANISDPLKHKKMEALRVSNVVSMKSGEIAWSVGVSGCGGRFLDGAAKSLGLRAPSVRAQVQRILKAENLDNSTADDVLFGLARRLNIEFESNTDLIDKLSNRYSLKDPSISRLVLELSKEVGISIDMEIKIPKQVQDRFRALALHTILQYTCDDYREISNLDETSRVAGMYREGKRSR